MHKFIQPTNKQTIIVICTICFKNTTNSLKHAGTNNHCHMPLGVSIMSESHSGSHAIMGREVSSSGFSIPLKNVVGSKTMSLSICATTTMRECINTTQCNTASTYMIQKQKHKMVLPQKYTLAQVVHRTVNIISPYFFYAYQPDLDRYQYTTSENVLSK